MGTSGFDVAAIECLTPAELRAQGSVKWSMPDGGSVGAWIAEMDFGLAPPIRAALHEALDTVSLGYLPPGLVTAMAAACAGFQRDRFGWDVRAEWVHPLPDVVKGFELAVEHFSRPGSPIILPTPAYMPFLVVPGMMKREIIEVPMLRDGAAATVDLDALDAAFRAGGHLLVLTNPHNPLGRVFEAQELAAVTAVVDRHGGRVFADEIHAPITFPGAVHVPYASTSETAAAHTVTATSASKAWNLPGLKCAQMILSNPADAAAFTGLGLFATHGASNLGVVANTVAYTLGGPWLATALEYLDGNRAALCAALSRHLPGVRMVPPEGTYLAWLDFRAYDLGDEPAAVVKERTGVVLVDGVQCGAVAGRGCARLNFATPRPILEEMIAAIGRALETAP